MHDVEDKVSRDRKRPRETPNNKKNVRLVWKEASRAEIETPMVIDDYIPCEEGFPAFSGFTNG